MLAATVLLLGLIIAFLAQKLTQLAEQLAARNPIEAATAKRIAQSKPARRQNGRDDGDLPDSLELGV